MEIWETPVYQSVRTKEVFPLAVSKFDNPPGFTKSCIDAEDAFGQVIA
jgi:hypothetical protein